MQRLIDENSEDAYQLAISQLAMTDLDILASSTALQNLCLIYVLRKGGGREELKAYYDKINGASDANYLLADNILEQAATLPFMKNKE